MASSNERRDSLLPGGDQPTVGQRRATNPTIMIRPSTPSSSTSPTSPTSPSSVSTVSSHLTGDSMLSSIGSVLPHPYLDALRRVHGADRPRRSSTSTLGANTIVMPSVTVTDAAGETPAAAPEHNGQRRFSQFYMGLRRFSNSHTVEFWQKHSSVRTHPFFRQLSLRVYCLLVWSRLV